MQPNRRWARKHESCVRCGGTEFPHKGRGLCTSCYFKEYNASRYSNESTMKVVQAVVDALRPILAKTGQQLVLEKNKVVLRSYGKVVMEIGV